MMGDRQVVQGALFYEFSLERHVRRERQPAPLPGQQIRLRLQLQAALLPEGAGPKGPA